MNLKRVLAIALVLMLTLCACASTMTVVNAQNYVSLREWASTSAPRIIKVPAGAHVYNVSYYNSEFSYCEYNGYYGYILNSYLSGYNATPVYGSTRYVVNCKNYVSLRSYASTNAACLIRVPLGAAVYNCSYYNSQFTYCEYNGYSGYILNSYLSGTVNAPKTTSTMRVVNCKNYVTLRSYASTKAAGLLTVPLGACVYNCSYYNSQFTYCEYGGYGGYILSSYLTPAY